MLACKARAPVHLNIVDAVATGARGSAHHYELLVRDKIDPESGPVSRLVDQGDVEDALAHLVHQILWQADQGSQRHIGRRGSHPNQPGEEERVPEAELATYSEHSAPTRWYRHLVAGSFPKLHKSRRMPQELLASRGQRCTGLAPDENRSSELFLEYPDASTNGGLAEMQALSGAYEAAAGDDGQEGSGELNIHHDPPYIQRRNCSKTAISFVSPLTRRMPGFDLDLATVPEELRVDSQDRFWRAEAGMCGRPDLLDRMLQLREKGEAYALATVVEASGSTSAKPGAKALLTEVGATLTGWVGGGCAEAAVRQAGLECLRNGMPKVVELDLDDEVLGTGMPCGGSMRVYVEPYVPPATLWVLGHGAVAECLCQSGASLGFRVVVSEPSATDPARFPDTAEIITDDYGYERLLPTAGDFVVIATQHKGDHLSAVLALRSPARYVAVIASSKRAGLVRDFLFEQGFSADDLAKLHAPAGLDLGAETPEEIALSVLSEVVMHRRGATGWPMRQEVGEELRSPRTEAGTPNWAKLESGGDGVM